MRRHLDKELDDRFTIESVSVFKVSASSVLLRSLVRRRATDGIRRSIIRRFHRDGAETFDVLVSNVSASFQRFVIQCSASVA
jgi:hypothetical protein